MVFRLTSYSSLIKATAETMRESLGLVYKRKIPDVTGASLEMSKDMQNFCGKESMGSYHRAKTSEANEIACSGKSELFLS